MKYYQIRRRGKIMIYMDSREMHSNSIRNLTSGMPRPCFGNFSKAHLLTTIKKMKKIRLTRRWITRNLALSSGTICLGFQPTRILIFFPISINIRIMEKTPSIIWWISVGKEFPNLSARQPRPSTGKQWQLGGRRWRKRMGRRMWQSKL